MNKLIITICLFIAGAAGCMIAENSKGTTKGLPLKYCNWNGFKIYKFVNGDANCIVVKPKKVATGKPWIWRARFFGHEPQTDIALLNKGFHVAYCDVANLLGAPKAIKRWDNFYKFATKKLGLSKKVTLEGMSRGGLIIFNWAKANPEKVSCIYGDAPVCDYKSWPGGKGKGEGAASVWKQCIEVYGFKDEAEALMYKGNPIDNAAAIAKAKIPVMIVYGKADNVVPDVENCLVFEKNFKAAGGEIIMIGKDRCGHHPHSLKDPTRIVDFIVKHSGFEEISQIKLPAAIEVGRGLINSHTIFEKGKTARVAFLGGSITEMPGWRNHVAASLRKRFPKTKFDIVYGGIGSTDSTMGAFRIDKDIFKKGKVDLLFIESAVNELHNGRTENEIVSAVEGVIRHAHKHNPEIDIIAQYFYDPSHLKNYRTGMVPWQIKTLNAVSLHYNIPSVNQVIYLNEALFENEITQEEFGGCHPKPKGHKLYIKAIDKLFDKAWVSKGSATAHKLSTPLREDNYENGTYLDIKTAEPNDGWKYIKKWVPSKGGTRKQFVNLPVLEVSNPGTELTLEFIGTAIGITIPAGYDAGILEFKIDNGDFKQKDLFTKWSRGLHIPWIFMLESNLKPGDHVLTLRMSKKKNSRSEGTACRICWFAVNPK
jgi:dienelactone hydrolase